MDVSWDGGSPKVSIFMDLPWNNQPAIGVPPWLRNPPDLNPLGVPCELYWWGNGCFQESEFDGYWCFFLIKRMILWGYTLHVQTQNIFCECQPNIDKTKHQSLTRTTDAWRIPGHSVLVKWSWSDLPNKDIYICIYVCMYVLMYVVHVCMYVGM